MCCVHLVVLLEWQHRHLDLLALNTTLNCSVLIANSQHETHGVRTAGACQQNQVVSVSQRANKKRADLAPHSGCVESVEINTE